MLRDKIKSCDSDTIVLNKIIDNQAISIGTIINKRANEDKQAEQQLETIDFSIQEVRHIKEEVIDVSESSNYEMSEYSDYDNVTYIDDKSANEIFFAESINFEAAYADKTISTEEVNDLAELYDLIDFTCTKCRKTSKNPDYFFKTTDLQCSNCQATMKFQCPRCKLMFRKFDSAVKHAKQSCPIGETTSATPMLLDTTQNDLRECLACGFNSQSLLEFRNHIRIKHPNDESAYVCSRCLRSYKSRDSMMKHLRQCGREPHIVCVFCGYRTKRREHLRVHMRHKHPDPESCHGGGYDCPKCKKKYKYLMPMKSHLKLCGLKKADTSSVEIGEASTLKKETR